MFNQGMLNVILDRTSGGPPVGVPRERPAVGLLNNLVRLTDKVLRNYDTARFELSDYLDGRDGSSRQSGVRISPYIRAVDHMENVVSALARGVSSRERLQTLGFGRGTAKMPDALRLELLCVPKFEVDLEFSGGLSEPGIVDVAVNVSVDGGQRGT